jgi:hypothetical protein
MPFLGFKMRGTFIFIILLFSSVALTAQTSPYRHALAMMAIHHIPSHIARSQSSIYMGMPISPPTIIPSLAAIPRYNLPRASVVCRLEQYVQLHSPLKLNIGLDGQ